MTARDVLILCVAYETAEIIKPALQSLVATARPRADICVVENHSERTELELKPYFLSCVERGEIDGYFLFDENITNNAVEAACDSGLLRLDDYAYVVVTDCDLLAPPGWLEAHIELLSDCPEVFSVSAPLSYDNLPAGMKAALEPHLRPQETRERYDVFRSGVHLTTFRSAEFAAFLAWRRRTAVHFRDRVLEHFGWRELGKVSARSRIAPAYHLSWDLIGLGPAESPAEAIPQEERERYLALKRARGASLWMHDDYCSYRFVTRHGVDFVFPSATGVRHADIVKRQIELVNDASAPMEASLEGDPAATPSARTLQPGQTLRWQVLRCGVIPQRLRLAISPSAEDKPLRRYLCDLDLDDLGPEPWQVKISTLLDGPG